MPLRRYRISSLGLLVMRIAVGLTFFVHGYQKFERGTEATAAGFSQLGIPSAAFVATYATYVEMAGGALLVLGLLTRLAALLLVTTMLGALVYAFDLSVFFATEGGYEYVFVLAGVCVGLVLTGSGGYGVDGLLRRKK